MESLKRSTEIFFPEKRAFGSLFGGFQNKFEKIKIQYKNEDEYEKIKKRSCSSVYLSYYM